MGGKKKKRWGIKLPKIKIKAPKITVGKDLGTENIGKAASAAVKAAGKAGEKYASTMAKGAEGIVANSADLGKAALKGDFKGIGKEALDLVQTGKDVLKGAASSQLGLASGLAGAAGKGIGDKNIQKGAENIQKEGQKGIDTYADTGIDVGLSLTPGVGQAYALGKAGASGLAEGGLKGFASAKGIQDAAIAAAGSKLGLSPAALAGTKAAFSAAQGDLKGAALQSLGAVDTNLLKDSGFEALSKIKPEELEKYKKQATTAIAGLTGDKKGLVSGLASQAGAGESLSKLVGSAATGDKKGLVSELASQAGAGKTVASMAGQIAAGKKAEDVAIAQAIKTGRGFASDEIGAYAKDIQNEALDKYAEQFKTAKDLARSAGRSAKDIEKNIQEARSAAEGAYKVAKGDTLGAIAKKSGLTVEQLMAANPTIKNANKIAAGMKINIPGAVKEAADKVQDLSGKIPAGARASVTDKFLKDASGKTIYGKNNAPIPNPSYDKKEADRVAAGIASAYEPDAQPEKGFLDKAKDFFTGAKDKVAGAVGAAGGFVKENPMLATGAIQAGAATAGFMAGQEARDEQEELLKKQILETQGVDALEKYELSKQRDQAYQDQQKFLEERIAGGGMTAKEREMQEEGRMKAAKMAAAGRLAGVEQMARMGQGATGAGSMLAASLAGAQAQAQAGAESERAVATSAAEQLERAQSARVSALESKAKTEIDLAQAKDAQELARLQEIGKARTEQRAMTAAEGAAKGTLAAGLADIATRGVLGQQIGPSDATDEERKIAAQAAADRKKEELERKAKAAQTVAQTSTNVNIQNQPPANQPPVKQADKFNQAGRVPTQTQQPKPATQQVNQQSGGMSTAQPQQGVQQQGIQGVLQGAQQKTEQLFSKMPAQQQQQLQQAKKAGEEALKKEADKLKQKATSAVQSFLPFKF